MIQAIVFDLDDTLYAQQEPFAQAIKQLFPTFPAEKMQALFIQFRYYSDLHYMKSISGEWSLEKMRHERIRLALEDFDFYAVTDDLTKFQAAYDEALNQISLPTETREIFAFLTQQKMPIAVITNGPVIRQNQKINALQLQKWIKSENIFISDALQIQKPDPEIFHLMAEKLALPADTILYIGDSFENDVVGAKSAGWQVWWFNHQGRELPAGQSAIYDLEINSFPQLKEQLLNEKKLQR
ncbi:HAD family hydrolase [Enterococcus devriesei]|uniref:HAD hydrolase, family IA n=1 Tax=Enterococcus devriesei TaxID=319970 RepID=A0A1L8SR33_9ENTE|nr:HAD family hydrolase [Enterococcus devriesei]OJG34302.1 HAD hydrolase, family IA [Enterococcus devriesei]